MKKSFHASHLELRYKTYYAVLYVPKDVRPIIGKTKFSQSTKTSDLKTAERRATALVLKWQNEISTARYNSSDPIITEALDLNSQFRQSADPLLRQAIAEIIEGRSANIKDGAEIKSSFDDDFNRVATGKSQVLNSLIAQWIKYGEARGLKAKTIDQMGRDIQWLTDTFTTAATLTPKAINAWIKLCAEENDFSSSSVTRIIGACRNFFEYLKEIGEVSSDESNPFSVPIEYKKSKKSSGNPRNKTDSWVPFKPENVVFLYKQALANESATLADLIKIGAYTGARIEEICSLKIANVDLTEKYLSIVDAKTYAGVRNVPIHSKLEPLIKKLVAEAKDEYLIPGLTFNKYQNRSNAIGKQFGRLKRQHGFSELHVFHSIRKTVTTLLENAKVGENIAADIVGHDKPRITYGLYSGGATVEVMREALEKLSYNFD